MNEPDIYVAPVFVMIMVLIGLLSVILGIALTVVPWCKICARAGFHWALGFLMMVPIVNIILPFYVAFADWPVFRKTAAPPSA